MLSAPVAGDENMSMWGERQHVVRVLEQNERIRARPARKRPMVGRTLATRNCPAYDASTDDPHQRDERAI